MTMCKDLLLSPKKTNCERIICLHRPGDFPNWHEQLHDPNRPLFAPPGRIVEAPMEHAHKETQRAVSDGLRPLLFVPDPLDWPDVYDAMGPYQDLGAIYVLGRHDQAMHELLHGPAPEVLEVYGNDGYVLVPNVVYGKALDELLDTSLTDFVKDDSGGQSDFWQPRFAFYSRLNSFRRLEITLDCRRGTANLTQFYDLDADYSPQPKETEHCNLSVSFADQDLAFHNGVCALGNANRELIDYIVWKMGLPAPQWLLFEQLVAFAQGARTHLSRPQQKLLFDVAHEAHKAKAIILDGVDSWLSSVAKQPPEEATQGQVRTHQSKVWGLPVLITSVEEKSDGTRFTLGWQTKGSHQHAPGVLIRVDGRRVAEDYKITWDKQNGELTVQGLRFADAELGWCWDAEQKVLELSIQHTPDAETEASKVQPEIVTADIHSAIPSKSTELLNQVGIRLVVSGREIVQQLAEGTLELLWDLYAPGALRLRGGRLDIEKETLEKALADQVPVLVTRLPEPPKKGILALAVQWVNWPPAAAPGLEVEYAGNQIDAHWASWDPDPDLAKVMLIESTSLSAHDLTRRGTTVRILWDEDHEVLRMQLSPDDDHY